MELAERYINKLENLKKALHSLANAMRLSLPVEDKILVQTIKSGQLQNFEFSIELLWKTIKAFLKEEDEIDAETPKQAIKEFSKAGYVDETTYEMLFSMMKDRNLLSHIYSQEEADAIIAKLPDYLNTMLRVFDILKSLKL